MKKHEVVMCATGCTVDAALAVIGGRWKGVILYYLLSGHRRFNELRRLLPGITQRMLTLQLRELETSGLLTRKVYAQVPPKVEYSLTELGRQLEPVLLGLKAWGQAYAEAQTGAPLPATVCQ